MPISKRSLFAFVLFLFSFPFKQALAQFPDKLKGGLRYYIDDKDSSRFIALNMVGQFWIRNTDNDPYTTVQKTA